MKNKLIKLLQSKVTVATVDNGHPIDVIEASEINQITGELTGLIEEIIPRGRYIKIGVDVVDGEDRMTFNVINIDDIKALGLLVFCTGLMQEKLADSVRKKETRKIGHKYDA
jgi:hypothetical protein